MSRDYKNMRLPDGQSRIRRLESELQLERSFAKHIVEASPLLICGIQPDGTTTFINKAIQEKTGYAQEEVIGKNWWTLFYPGDEYRQVTDLFAAFERGEVKDYQMTLTTKYGEKRTVAWNSVNRFSVSGELVEVVGVGLDVTDLLTASHEAEKANKAKSSFLANMSHELRTPLTLILGPVEDLFAREKFSDRVSGDLQRIQRNGFRLLNLVNDVLDLTKVEAKKMEPSWERVDLQKLMAEVTEDVSVLTEDKNIRLSYEVEGEPAEVWCDSRMMEKVALNLLSNAVKFTPAGGSIQVTVRFSEENFHLRVRDTGIGIAPEKVGGLFGRFQQVDESIKRKYGGTGIGLALVKEFIGLMDGSVSVESRPGEGSVFEVAVPRRERRLVLGTREAEGNVITDRRFRFDPPSGAKVHAPLFCGLNRNEDQIRILIADDEADMRNFIVGSLGATMSDRHVVTVAAGNGAEAYRLVAEFQPHVVVSDVMMPEMNGLELVEKLKCHETFRHIPVILLTARASREDLVSGLESGADDYLAKPFGPSELRARLLAAFRLASMNRKVQELQKQMAVSAKMTALGEMAGGIAHEINTPLATIKLVSAQIEEILKERPEQLDTASYMLSKIGRTVDRIAKIVQGLRFFSRDASNDPYQRVRLQTLIDDTVVLCQEKYKSVGIRLDVESFDENLEIETRPVELSQVLLNLLSNAKDAVEKLPEKWVKIAVAESGGLVSLRVTDSGSGIPADVHKKLFQPFFTTKEIGKGTGLGLPIAAGIIGSHGGVLKLDTDCRNTSFVIQVPRERPKQAAA